jgi:hypothetical protein
MFEGLYPLLYTQCKMQDLVEMDKNKKSLNFVLCSMFVNYCINNEDDE